MKRKNRLLFGFSTASTLAAIAYLQMAPMPTARAQTTDPGQNPDPVPHQEATPTPTPCPDARKEGPLWNEHAVLHGFTCKDGAKSLDQTSGSYRMKTIDPCNGDKTEVYSSSWKITDTEVRDEVVDKGTANEDTIHITWYFVQGVGSDGQKFYGEWQEGRSCCVGNS